MKNKKVGEIIDYTPVSVNGINFEQLKEAFIEPIVISWEDIQECIMKQFWEYFFKPKIPIRHCFNPKWKKYRERLLYGD